MPATKQYYRIEEVSLNINVPSHTLRYWEKVFPMFNPNRAPSGQRRFTAADIKMANTIKELLYVKGMTIEGAIMYLNAAYYLSPPHGLRKCESTAEAIALLDEVEAALSNAHTIVKIESVKQWLKKQG